LLWAGWQPDASPTPLQWTTIDGKTVRLSDLRDAKAVVFITLSTRCPAVPRYAPRLNRLYETYHPRGVAFYGIYPEADETLEGIRAHAQQLGLQVPRRATRRGGHRARGGRNPCAAGVRAEPQG
jgi:peroxiredoxin